MTFYTAIVVQNVLTMLEYIFHHHRYVISGWIVRFEVCRCRKKAKMLKRVKRTMLMMMTQRSPVMARLMLVLFLAFLIPDNFYGAENVGEFKLLFNDDCKN